MSSLFVYPAKNVITKEPTTVKGLTPTEDKNQRKYFSLVENGTTSVAEPGTLDYPEAGSGVSEGNETKYNGDIVF